MTPSIQYGALVNGPRNASSTVEARTVASGRLVLLLGIQGDLATPALESIKGMFARVDRADVAAAARLVAAAPPAPYCEGVAVVLLEGTSAIVASSGAARCYLERGGVLAELAAGSFELAPGDAIVAASDASLAVGRVFLGDIPDAPDEAFHNDRLDAALLAALSSGPRVAVAAARRNAR